MLSYKQMILITVVLVFLGTEHSDGKPLSRRIRNRVRADGNSPHLSEAKENALERASIRMMRTLMSLETDREMKTEISSFIHNAKRIRAKRYAELEFTRDYVKNMEDDAARRFKSEVIMKKNFSVDQIECFSRAIAYINQPEFISLLDKC